MAQRALLIQPSIAPLRGRASLRRRPLAKRPTAMLDWTEASSFVHSGGPQVVLGQLADASNLGFLDPGAGPPPADWAWSPTPEKFEPGEIRIDPKAIFASSILGLILVDFSLQSMNAPSIQQFLRDRAAESRQEKRKAEFAEELKKLKADEAKDIDL